MRVPNDLLVFGLSPPLCWVPGFILLFSFPPLVAYSPSAVLFALPPFLLTAYFDPIILTMKTTQILISRSASLRTDGEDSPFPPDGRFLTWLR